MQALRLSARRIVGRIHSRGGEIPLAPRGAQQLPRRMSTYDREEDGKNRVRPKEPLHTRVLHHSDGFKVEMWNDTEVEEMEEFVKVYPLLIKVGSDRVIIPDLNRPCMSSEMGNRLISSGFRHIRRSHKQGVSTLGEFTKGNVGVLRRFSAIVPKKVSTFRPLKFDDSVKRGDYQEYYNYICGLIIDQHGLQAFLGCEFRCIHDLITSSMLDEELIVNNASLLPRIGRAIFIMRAHDYLIEEVPLHLKQLHASQLHASHHRFNSSIRKIFDAVPYTFQNSSANYNYLTAAQVNILFKCWLPKKTKGQKKGRVCDGEGMVLHHRNGVVHYFVEQLLDMLKLMKKTEPVRYASLMAEPPTFNEVVDGFRYTFPEFAILLQKALREAGDEHYAKLNMWELFHLSDLHAGI